MGCLAKDRNREAPKIIVEASTQGGGVKWLFWISAVLVFYTYLGYPLVLLALAKLRHRPVGKRPIEPAVSIVVAVRNEAMRLQTKLRNLGQLEYPKQRLEIIVVSDGSTDGTAEVLTSCDSVRAVISIENVGKAEALNRALSLATGDIVVFTDVRQEVEPQAVRELVANFADPQVGCVSGALMLRRAGDDHRNAGVSTYWAFEKLVRRLEASSGSVVGATGALYAVRRSMLPVLPQGTLLDDVYVPLAVARNGGRVIFEPNARAWDDEAATPQLEFGRKVRTLAGNYQLLQLAPWLMTSANPLRFRLVSHKLLRLVVPFLLIIIFGCSVVLAQMAFYAVLALAQVLFYLLAAAGLRGWRLPMASSSASFCALNAAAGAALVKFWRYRNHPVLLWKGGYPNASAAQPYACNRVASGRTGRCTPGRVGTASTAKTKFRQSFKDKKQGSW